MKKALSLLLAIVMVLTVFAGCGKTEDQNASSDFKVGAIYINSQNDQSGYTYAHHHGITKAMENLGLSKDQLYIIDNVPEDYTEVSTAIDTLAGKGCKIIFGISFGYINAFADAAEKEEYKDIIFSHGTGYLSNATNFNNYFGRIYQARYLSGLAAGLKTLETGNNEVGFVSAWGTEYAETCSGINAFALGVQAINPNATVHVKEISTWGDEALEKSAAELLINTYNCGVVAQHCDSAQPQLTAESAGVFGCGYNSDMSAQAPNSHLTAPVWNWDVYYQLAIETAMNDSANFMSKVGNYYGGLKEGFVDIAPLTANCAANTESVIKVARDMMVNGEWDVFSGVKLSYDGTTLSKVDSALKTNDGTEIVAAGGASVEDGVITGSMNYFVEGVVQE